MMKKYIIKNRSKMVILCLLILIVGLGSFLRIYHIGKLSFWLDEVCTYFFSVGSFTHLGTVLKTDPNMSLYYVFAHFWIRFFPNASDGRLRALSAIFSVASIPVVYLLGKAITTDRKKGTAIGLIAAFLIAVNAFHIQYAQEFRSYSLTFLLTALSTLFLIKTVEEPESKILWPAMYTIVTAAAFYSHFFAAFLIAAQAATLPLLLINKNESKINFKRILWCGLGIIILILPISVVAYRAGTSGVAWVPSPTFETLMNFFIEISGNFGMPLLVLTLLFACVGLISGLGAGSQQDLITRWKVTLMAGCLLLPVFAAFVISKIMTPIFMDRYLFYVMPYLAILTAAGIVAFADFRSKSKKFGGIFIPISVGALVLVTWLSAQGIQSYDADYQKQDWKGASEMFTTRCSDSLRLYYSSSINPALYYNPALESQEEEWWETALAKNPGVDELAASLPKGYRKVCLVLSMIDSDQKIEQQKIIRAALQKEFPEKSDFNFYGIEIEIYKR
jgi:uncharacterized membrane protein